MSIKKSISIIDYGASTINGTSAEMSYAMNQANQKFFRKHEIITDFYDNPITIGKAGYIDENAEFIERFITLGKNALQDTVKSLDPKKINKIKMLVGLPEKREGIPQDLEEGLKPVFEDILKKFTDYPEIRFFYGGHAVVTKLIEGSLKFMKENTICIVGGIDSYQTFDMLSEMRNEEKLLSVGNKYGIIASEGAGFITLASPENAKRMEQIPHAEILNADTKEEKEEFSKGWSLTKTMKEVLKKLPKNTRCNRIMFDLNKRESSLEFGCSYIRMPKVFSDDKTIFRLPGSIGDVGTATIPLLIVHALEEAKWGDESERFPVIISVSDPKEKASVLLELKRFNEVESYKIA
ncbi:MAG: hypothetical protein GY714_33035 [Desulfobacterales bacterium]|nr:hypothetical protein [Desulfobacterales bacterium]